MGLKRPIRKRYSTRLDTLKHPPKAKNHKMPINKAV